MKDIYKLGRKLAVLGVMLFALGFVVFTDVGRSSAAPCCSECETLYDDCIGWGGTPAQCIQMSNNCWRRCVMSC